MENYDDIYTELKELAPLLSEMKKENVYELPKDYFLSFSQLMQEKIAKGEVNMEMSELSPLLSQLQKPILEKVPATYFSSLSESLLATIRATEVQDELSIVAPSLAQTTKENLYPIPATYFNSLPQEISKRIQQLERQEQKEVSKLSLVLDSIAEAIQGFFARPSYSFAVISCVGLLIIGGIFWISSDQADEQKIVAQMQQLEDGELQNYLAMNISDISEHHILQQTESVDFTNFLDNTKEMNTHIENYMVSDIDEDAVGKELKD